MSLQMNQPVIVNRPGRQQEKGKVITFPVGKISRLYTVLIDNRAVMVDEKELTPEVKK
jgi:hypothetical protein